MRTKLTTARRERESYIESSDGGLGLLFRFLIAAAVAVAAVMLAVAVDEMWILAPAMAVHLFMAFFVLDGIARLLKD
jgi:membrane protein YdbS with pleckstrin-like domain